ncbi:MAG: hypothetical protein AB1485_09960 [Candidatus Thermoplasmatota archaeon]
MVRIRFSKRTIKEHFCTFCDRAILIGEPVFVIEQYHYWGSSEYDYFHEKCFKELVSGRGICV